MIDKIKSLSIKHRETIAYLFIGGTTVLVNIVIYWLLLSVMSDIPANTIAFFVAVMYAYFSNCLFVFQQRLSWSSFRRFWVMRIGTLIIDDGGLWLLLEMNCNRLIAKFIVSVFVIIVNYIFSKFFVFKGASK